MQQVFVHHVFFWLKDPASPAVRGKFERALEELVTIGTIASHHLGVPAPTRRPVIDSSYTYSLLTLFKTQADQDAYQVDPIHLKFVRECQDLWARVVVFDSVDK